jgi:hypothetical protein
VPYEGQCDEGYKTEPARSDLRASSSIRSFTNGAPA